MGVTNRQNAWLVSASTFVFQRTHLPFSACGLTTSTSQYRSFGALEYFGLNANEALSYAFVAPPEGTAGNFTFAESTTGDFVGNFMSLTHAMRFRRDQGSAVGLQRLLAKLT